ncbi:MAG: sulfatase-like hydrolase/transferase, partial [Parabacteroides gordonii]
MNNRTTFIGLLALCSATLYAEEAGHRPMNILLIMADDFGYECLSANGSDTYSTPNIDRLANRGIRFNRCYSNPLSTPSRVQLMTGKYNVRNYVAFGQLDRKEVT